MASDPMWDTLRVQGGRVWTKLIVSLLFDSVRALANVLRIPVWLALVLLFVGAFVALIGSLFVLTCVLFWPLALASCWVQISKATQDPLIRIAGAAVCLLIGGLLYLVRTYLRSLYGFAEVLVGAAACWAALGKPLPNAVPGPLSPDVIAGTLPLAAGLYIIVRGIDNFLHKDARKHVTKKLEAPTKGKEVSNGLPAESRKAVSGGSGDSSE